MPSYPRYTQQQNVYPLPQRFTDYIEIEVDGIVHRFRPVPPGQGTNGREKFGLQQFLNGEWVDVATREQS